MIWEIQALFTCSFWQYRCNDMKPGESKNWHRPFSSYSKQVSMPILSVNLTLRNQTRIYLCLGRLTKQAALTCVSSITRTEVSLAGSSSKSGVLDDNLRANPGTSSCTPLFWACATCGRANLDFVKLLLEHRADPNLGNVSGETPHVNTLTMTVPAATQIRARKDSAHR